MKSATVIGAGIGGLLIAAILTLQGLVATASGRSVQILLHWLGLAGRERVLPT